VSRKVSRYEWPAAKADRIALIVANLTVAIPTRRYGRRAKAVKDEAERDESEEREDETHV
jgi:hypothetical protein